MKIAGAGAVLLVLAGLSVPVHSQEEPSKKELAELSRGRKVLVQVAKDLFDGPDRDLKIRRAIKDAGAKLLKTLAHRFYLVDFGERDPEKALEKLPHRMGALVFKDGALVSKIPVPKTFPDRRFKRNPKGKKPDACAVFHWGSASGDMEQMRRDIARWKKDPRVEAKVIRPGGGRVPVQGNPTKMELRPKGTTTLLEVFLISGRGFEYSAEDEEDKEDKKD